jgi:predicted Zn-dependent peptidase
VTRLVESAPEPAEPRPWRFPAFERGEAAGGRFLSCHLPGKPLTALTLVVDAGATTEPTGREGVALVTARALGEGTLDRDAYAFAVATERIGAAWNADADWDSLRCGFEVPADALPEALDLLAEAVRTPSLSDEVVERVRDERTDELRIEASQPAPVAAAAFAAALFDPASRYARQGGGDLDTVPALSTDDVRAFHAARFAPSTVTLVVAGDLTGLDVASLAERLFAGWGDAQPAPAEPAVTPATGGRRIVVVDRPGSVQSMLFVGHRGPRRLVPDYVPLTTMAFALGGLFNSRLNLRLREEKGYTYGANAGFDLRRHGGVFAARTAVQTDTTAPAVAETVAEIERMHGEGVTPDELDHVRRFRTGVFPVSFATAPAVAEGLAGLVVHDLPDDYFDTVRREFAEVPKEEVDRAARERLAPDELVTVVVGDTEQVRVPLEATGIGPVEVVRDLP